MIKSLPIFEPHDEAVIHSTTSSLDNKRVTVVGISSCHAENTFYIVQFPKPLETGWSCLTITNACLKKVETLKTEFEIDHLLKVADDLSKRADEGASKQFVNFYGKGFPVWEFHHSKLKDLKMYLPEFKARKIAILVDVLTAYYTVPVYEYGEVDHWEFTDDSAKSRQKTIDFLESLGFVNVVANAWILYPPTIQLEKSREQIDY